ncbi:Nucleoid occlusion protein [Sphingobium sp. AntQ-1]|uniref:ParB/RepB/Spo0J family partition protein n=1 Tax=Sphingobium sp. AntQ-1 TaxID=2930091 RepID=UPI00234EB27D|nr:ParB N-terminal domain-containing protein [Sphingobium sp. AntQ-1]WCP13322.1 Nucleoid occlusion protein [Sphingobium sp. AntQ-1]
MTLVFIAPDKLSVSRTNMRYGRKAPDVSDILPTVRKRGVIQTLLVRPTPVPSGVDGSKEGHFEIIAGARRFHAALIVAQETGEAEPLPCRILSETDDAAAIEASMIENLARLDADEVTQWATFTRLVKEGRTVDDIAATFGLPDLTIARVLALGNLLPRIRAAYAAEKIDRTTVRHLTLASKSQQRSWLALFDDPDSYVPTGHQLKAWLFGGQSIPSRFALFDLDTYKGATIADLFGDDRYFADADAFWTAQNAAIEARRTAYLEEGWSDVVIVPPSDPFHSWEYEKAAKRKGGRVYTDVRATGEVSFHEGYLTRKEVQRVARGEGSQPASIARPEITSTMQTYIDLHRHAAVRAALLGHPGVALRLMVAHAIGGSHLWRVSPEPQSSRNDGVRESLETCRAETVFDERRRAILDMLGVSPEEPTIVGSHVSSSNGGDGDAAQGTHDSRQGVAGIFDRLIELPDAVVMEIITIVMGETMASGSAAVAAAGTHIGIDMADWWEADAVFFELVRDRQVLSRIVAEVAGETVASANAGEKAKVLKSIVADHLAGANGRAKVERWVPRWMAFPASAYTTRGGVGTVAAQAKAEVARSVEPQTDSQDEPFEQAA